MNAPLPRPDGVRARLGRARRHAYLAAALADAARRSPAMPLKLTVALTWRCSHRCAVCSIWQRPAGDELDAGELDRMFASHPGLVWLDLTGGEVLARKDLPAIVASIRRRLRRLALLHFPTAGMSPRRTLAAARSMRWPGGPRLAVSVSVDGPPALHDRLRGVPGAFDRAVATLALLRDEPGVDVFAGMTLQPGNVDAIEPTLGALAGRLPGFGADDLHVNVMHRSEHYFGNAEQPTPEAGELQRALTAFVRRKGLPSSPYAAVEAAYLRLFGVHQRTGRSPLPCGAAELSAYVAPDGTVHACTIDPLVIGRLDAFDFDLAALWSTARRRAVRAEVRAERCAGCWTPCEAYQTLLTQPLALARAAALG